MGSAGAKEGAGAAVRRWLGCAVVVLAVVSGSALSAQSELVASPLLPPEHWAVEAARRLDAMGLAPGYLPAQRAVPRHAVAAALREGAERAAAVGPAWAELAVGWWARFEGEFPEFGRAGAGQGLIPLGGAAAAGYAGERGVAGPGAAEFFPERTGATPLPDRSEAVAALALAAGFGRNLSLAVAPVVGTEEARLARGELTAGWRSLRLSVGRAEVGYGVGRGGGVIFSGLAPLDRVELSTSTPVRLPGWFGWLGPFAFHTFVARLPEERHPGAPVLTGGSASARPHPRLTLSAHRALMMGGDGVEDPVGPGDLLPALIGQNVPGMNQIASTSFRLRLPTERWMPVSLYCEWGAEDTSGAPFAAPGLVCGGHSPALPGLPAASLGVEHAQFGVRPPDGPPWYRHHKFPGAWALGDVPLGHPVGGEGRQWLAYSQVSALEGRLELDGRIFWRERTGENLFLPGRDGRSRGLAAAAAWRVRADAELRLAASREQGEGWRESRVSILAGILF